MSLDCNWIHSFSACMAEILVTVTVIQWILLCIGQTQSTCLQTNNENGLPTFQGYGYRRGEPGAPERRIHHQHQAIIPSYRFNCCGNITEWGVDLNPAIARITFNFDFQVWRPSPTVNETGCYSLVNKFVVRSISLPTSPMISHVARVTPSPQYQLKFQPGDVLGFYVESHGEGSQTGGDDNNGVVLLNSTGYTSELVWHGHITAQLQPSRSVSCPYPVGTNGVLNSSTRAAPVISISITTHSCFASTTHPSPSPIPTLLPTDNVHFVHPNQNETSAKYTDNILILVVSLPVISLLGIVIIAAVMIMVVVMIIRRFKSPINNRHGPNPSNYTLADGSTNMQQVGDSELHVYNSPTVNTAYSIQLKPNEAYGALPKKAP